MSISGIDISQWQGVINWTAAGDPGQGLEFAVAKCTEGNGFTDPTFVQNITAIRQTRLVPGHYHYGRPDLNPGTMGALREADWFLSQAGWRQGEIVMLDQEAPGAGGDLSGWSMTWLDHVAAVTGASPFFYSYRSYIQTRGGPNYAALASKYGLWIAASTVDPQPPWHNTALWQDAANSHFVAGIGGAVDFDIFFGSRADLLKYCGGEGEDMTDEQDQRLKNIETMLLHTVQEQALEDEVIEVGPSSRPRRWLSGPSVGSSVNLVAQDADAQVEVIAYDPTTGGPVGGRTFDLVGNQPNVAGPVAQWITLGPGADGLNVAGPATIGLIWHSGGDVAVTLHS